jgi:CheY-like chemotaxis protein
MKILVVDDELDVKMLFEQFFEDEIEQKTIEIEYAHTGEDALKYINTLPDHSTLLILSDINMPGMTGLELLRQIKQLRPNLKVIMLSAYDDDENRQKAKAYGCDGFINKPIDFALLKVSILNL